MSTFRQRSFTGGILSDATHARDDLAAYSNSVKTLMNCFIHAHGGASNRAGLRMAAAIDADLKTRLIPFKFNRKQSYILSFANTRMQVVKDGGMVLDGADIFTRATPFIEDQLSLLKYAQSNDVMTICHEAHAPKDLARLDHDDWILTDLTFAPEIEPPGNFAISQQGAAGIQKYKYTISAVSASSGEESIGAPIKAITTGVIDMHKLDSNYIDLSWDALPAADYYRVYRWDEVQTPLWGLLAETDELQHQDQGKIIPDTAQTYQQGNDPFTTFNPDASPAYFAQRKCYAKNGTVFMSQTGNFKNHNISRPVAADDAIEYTIADTESNVIEHLVPLQKDLVALTDGGEWLLSAGEGRVSIDTLTASKQSSIGCSYIPPITIRDTLLYIGVDQRSVHDFGYELTNDNYSGNDRTILATHLFEGRKIIDWAWAQYPHKTVWCVMDDGTLTSLAYMKEHQVWGWAQHETDGAFESVAVIRENGVDVPYFVIKRIIGGQEKRFIEYLDNRDFETVEDCFFVDCGLTYDGAPATIISGLDHLEGRAVVALADGKTVDEIVVNAGTIKLPFAASKVHVGLPYVSTIATLDLMSDQIVLDGRKKNVSEAIIRYKNSRGVQVGARPNAMRPLNQREKEDSYKTMPFRNGIKSILVASEWSDGGNITVQQNLPLPMTILSIALEVQIGG